MLTTYLFLMYVMTVPFTSWYCEPKNNLNKILEYNPETCTVLNYDFTFLYDKVEEMWKVHGLWPEKCAECENCGYPSCCDVSNINYYSPNDTTNFITTNWFNSKSMEQCVLNKEVELFEHEYYKHISCTNLKTSDEFLQLVMFLYSKYYDLYVNSHCTGYEQLWLSLDSNFNYNGTQCL